MTEGGFGQYIRIRRKLVGMNQGALAQAVGAKDRTYITQIESGRIKLPGHEMRLRIADRAGGEPEQREIAEEERGGRSGKVDHVEPQIRLDMIELRTVAQESDTPTFALQRL
jgi:transcriptional regulator with XRE-family HTH domain